MGDSRVCTLSDIGHEWAPRWAQRNQDSPDLEALLHGVGWAPNTSFPQHRIQSKLLKITCFIFSRHLLRPQCGEARGLVHGP